MSLSSVVYEEDCVAGIRARMRRGSVDVVVTSPPYNFGIKYAQYDDSRDEAAYLKWMGRVSASLAWVLAPGGSLFLNLGAKPSNPFWPIEVVQRFRSRFKLQNTILWIKSIAISAEDVGSNVTLASDIAVGHYKPVNSTRFLNSLSEYVFHLTKKGDVPLDKLSIGVPYQDKSNVVRWGEGRPDLRDRGNVWFIPYDTIQRSRPHPCVFPVKLPRMCIQLHGLAKTRLVLDPFLGTGTTGVASAQLRRDFVGFDVDGKYARMARESIQEACRSPPLRLADSGLAQDLEGPA